MSYQQAGYQQPGYQQGYGQAYPVAPRSSGVLLIVGVILVLVGIVCGGALFVAGNQRYTSKVKSLAVDSGALSGCITDLTITKPGTYTLFYISKGDLHINGANDGCASSDVVPISADPSPSEIAVKITNSADKTLKLFEPANLREVRAGGVAAVPYKQVKIGVVGSFRIEITPPDTGLPFGMGLSSDVSKPSNVPAVIVGLVGIVFGIGFALLGLAQGGSSRRRYPSGYATPQQAGGYAGYPPQAGYPVQPPPQPQAPPVRRPPQAPPVQRPPVAGASGPRPPGASAPQRPGTPAPRQPGAPAPQRPGASAPRQPGAPAPQRPVGPAPAGRPTQVPPVDRTDDLPATIRQPQTGAPRPAAPRPPGSVPPGGGLPPIISSDDESGSLNTAPPTRPMPPTPGATGWERPGPRSEPTRPVSSERPGPDFDPDEDLD